MKQKLLKSILLLFALVVGSSSVWAETYTYTLSSGANGFFSNEGLTTHPGTGSSNKISQFYAADGKLFEASATNIYFSAASGGYLFVTSGVTLTLPTYSGEKITAISLSNSSGCSTSVSVSIVSGSNTAAAAQTWSKTSSTYNYSVEESYQSSTLGIKVATKNAQITKIVITTEKVAAEGTTAAPSISGTETFLTSTTVTLTNAAASEGAKIYYTLNGEDPTTTTSATCFEYTEPFELTATTTVKAIAKHADDTNASTVVSKTFTKVTPMTVAQGIAVAEGDDTEAKTGAYVRGIISQIDSYSSNTITYWISDDGTKTTQLEVYKGVGLNGANFTAKSDLELGDEVVVYGNLTVYNSTPEFNSNSQLIYFYRTPKYVINFAAAPVAGGTIDALDSNADDVASGDKFVEGETLTLSATANTGYTFANWTATGLTIAETDKTKNDLDVVMPANEVTLTANFTANTYALTANSAHGALTVMVDGAEWNGTDEIAYNANVSIAVAAEAGYKFKNWTITGATLADDTAEPAEFTMPAGDVTITANFSEVETRPVNWFVNGTKIRTDNVAVGEAITFTAPDDVPAGYVFQYWSSTQIDGVSATEAGTKATAQTAETGVEYNYYAVIAEVTGTTPASWTAEELANLTSSDVFVIVGTASTESFAMSNDKAASNPPSAVKVSISGNNLTSDVAENIKWNISGNATDGYTFYPNGSTATWLYTTNANNGVRVGINDNKVFTVSGGYLKNNGTKRFVGIYNSQDWRCYENTTGNIADETFSFYKYVAPNNTYSNYCTSLPTATITLASACTDGAKYYGTYSNNSAFVVPADLTVSAITAVGTDGKLTVTDYAEGDIVKANTGVLVSATSAGEKTVVLTAVDGTEKDGNMLKASGDAGIKASAMNEADTKFYRLTMHNGTQIGFWWGAESGAAFDIAANKAYLAVPNTGAAREGLWLDFGGETTGVSEKVTVKSDKFATAPIYNLNGQRVAQPTRGLYIVNGRKVLVP